MPDKKGFPLRLDPEVYDALQRWAASELRSVNGQIEYLLRSALRDSGRLGADREQNSEAADARRKRSK